MRHPAALRRGVAQCYAAPCPLRIIVGMTAVCARRCFLRLMGLIGCCLVHQALARPDAAEADAAIRAFATAQGIPAMHVTLLRADAVILQRGYGAVGTGRVPPDADALFPLGSISKQFTAALILSLADAGKLSLDAPVSRYLPEWFAHEPDLRVQHLLAQASGVADFLWLKGYRPLADDPTTPASAFVALAAAAPRRFAPGTRWAYSNTNYKALAMIAERVSGRSFDDALAEWVLRPAAIDGVISCHRLRPEQFVAGVSGDGKPTPLDASAAAYVGDGGLCGSAKALTAWVRRTFAPRTEATRRLTQPSVLTDGTQVPYANGVSTRAFLERAMLWHGGNVDSHSTMIAYLPDEDMTLVLLTSKGFVWLTELMPALIGAARPARAAASAAPLSGLFEDGLFRYAVTRVGPTMRVKIDLIDTFAFVPAGGREYVAEKLPATFRIRLPADGSRDGFELDWGEVRSYARRVKN